MTKYRMPAIAACVLAAAPAMAQTDTAWMNLFNGKDLNGWGYVAGNWKADSGMIVGKAKSTYNNFCHPTRKFSDFQFAIRARLWEPNNTDYINSGIQYRSAWIDSAKHSLKGYQMDIGDGYNGSMYPEGGYPSDARGAGQSAACKAAVKLNDWNQYVITANGTAIRHEMNGKICAEYTGSVKEGYIGLQLHFTSVVMEVDFKDAFIRPLNNSFAIPDSQRVFLNPDYTLKGGGTSARPVSNATLAFPPTLAGNRLTIPALWRGNGRSIHVSLLDASGRTWFSRSIIAGDELPLVIGLPNFGAGNHLLRIGSGPDAYSRIIRLGD